MDAGGGRGWGVCYIADAPHGRDIGGRDGAVVGRWSVGRCCRWPRGRWRHRLPTLPVPGFAAPSDLQGEW